MNLLNQMLERIVPPLAIKAYKGQAGKICVIGGSKEYTGAPYFAAISALYCGADLVHVICPDDAASVIKSYSPELIVHPILNKDLEECKKWIQRMHAVVIGPGLGRDNVHNPSKLMEYIRECNIPLVIDADALHIIANNPQIIQGYNRVILTPNIAETKVLFSNLVKEISFEEASSLETCQKLSSQLGNVTVLRKGLEDYIVHGKLQYANNEEGSPRRCGGQGDLLSGSLGLFLHWAYMNSSNWDSNCLSNFDSRDGVENIVAAMGASKLTRKCAKMAFGIKRRATTTTDMIECIGEAFVTTFGQ